MGIFRIEADRLCDSDESYTKSMKKWSNNGYMFSFSKIDHRRRPVFGPAVKKRTETNVKSTISQSEPSLNRFQKRRRKKRREGSENHSLY